MKKISLFKKIVIASSICVITTTTFADELKRFSVSAGWLHVMPQGKANPFNINTPVKNGEKVKIGAISTGSILNSLDMSQENGAVFAKSLPTLEASFRKNPNGFYKNFFEFGKGDDANTVYLKDTVSGSMDVNGIESWRQQGTGLEAEDADTLGLMFNYYINDNVSLQLIGGVPPKVDIKGKGQITASVSGDAKTEISADLLPILADIPITNLGNKSKAASVRAWTPALEAQYQFGKSGVNKFRPYVGAGVMYAHFNDIKLNGDIKSDLIEAGHMIQNVLDGQAGAALDGKTSSASPYVKVKAEDAFAPIVSLGATYDINQNWFGVASVSYAKLNNKATINVIDKNTGNRLIHATTKIDIDPIITYVGVGYRF